MSAPDTPRDPFEELTRAARALIDGDYARRYLTEVDPDRPAREHASADLGETLAHARAALAVLDPPAPPPSETVTPELLRAAEYTKTADDEGERREAVSLWRAALDPPAPPLLPEALTGAGWDEVPPAREWLVRDWLPAGELSLLSGPGSVGKSLFTLQLGAALACDRGQMGQTPVPGKPPRDWLPQADLRTAATAPDLCAEPVPVVLAGWEDSRHEALRRRIRMQRYGGCPWAADPSIMPRLHVLPMRGRGPVWAPAEGGSRHIATVGELTPIGAELRAYCERIGARLLVMDPSSLALALDENARPLVSLALEAWAGWALTSGCAVMLTGHPAKATEGEGADYSGSTAWRGLVRALWTLRQPDGVDPDELANAQGADPAKPERIARWHKNKNNYGWDGLGLTLRTVGERAGWELIDTLPPAKRTGTAGTAPARKALQNGVGKVPDVSEV